MRSMKKVPSKIIEDQIAGKIESANQKPEIIQFLNIADNSIYTTSDVDIDEPLFQPIPIVVQFSNYEPLITKEAVLRLRNKDSVARRIKLISPDSRLFQVTRSMASKSEIQGTKVAPGMEISFIIKFTPEAKIDYQYDLIATTEREKFIIPIRALGLKTMIQFPDSVDFGECMVKHTTHKAIMISNIGQTPTKWSIEMPAPFSADRLDGLIEVGQVEQLSLSFHPTESRGFKGNIILRYATFEAYVEVKGEARNNPNVFLSVNQIDFDPPTYITLSSQKTLKIFNKTTVPVEFEWRAFASEREENEKKGRIYAQLEQEEAEERMRIEETNLTDSEEESLDFDDSYDAVEEKNMKDNQLKKAVSALERKYKNIRKAVESDLMLFYDDIFNVEPISGKIWPDSEIQITITFNPVQALKYTCPLYCNTTCLQERLEMKLTATGIGPKAKLNFHEYDIGDVCINQEKDFQDRQIEIENKGDIPCSYEIVPFDTPFSNKFQFDHYRATLTTEPPNNRKQLDFNFCSDILGEFSETFRINLFGSSEVLPLVIKGHVMAPSFEFDREEIDFHQVSYNFPNPERVTMTNTSAVPIDFDLRVPGDGKTGMKKEFSLHPETGTLKPMHTLEIQIEFTPHSVRKYDMVLVVDIDGVGQDMHALPLRAESFVPNVEIDVPSSLIDFEKVFLRHPYTYDIQMRNDSNLQAKFEVLPQDDQSKTIAEYNPDQQEGYIMGNETATVRVELIPQKSGQIRLPMYIKIIGHQTSPHMLTIMAQCSGPKIKVMTNELDFGSVNVLENREKTAVLFNKSDIAARYVAFTRKKDSIFKIPEREGELQPGETKEITIICHADECMAFSDVIDFHIREGRDAEVVVKAKGKGRTAYCKDKLDNINFGTAFTCRDIKQSFMIENKGRKPQKLTWVRTGGTKGAEGSQSVRAVAGKTMASSKSMPALRPAKGGSTSRTIKPEEPEFIFEITPNSITLNPKTWMAFQFKANASIPGHLSEQFECHSIIGKARTGKPIFHTTLHGNFIEPFLQFSKNKLHFKYVWDHSDHMDVMSQDLTITCVAELPTKFMLKVAPPFSINVEQFALDPGQSGSLRVDFDPSWREDRKSGDIPQKLQIIHVDHPNNASVDLVGEMWFPNLQFDSQEVDFGCILNQTMKKIYVKMTNTSILDVKYNWTFIEEEIVITGQEQRPSLLDNQEPLNEVFDILPLSGVLGPNETETVEFVYNSFDGKKRTAIALCEVEGGPEYELNLIGQGDQIRHQLSRYNIDFESFAFNETKTNEFFIENTGQVPFEFHVNTESISRKGVVEVSPLRGLVPEQDKKKITVKMTPGIPDKIEEYFLVELAHFDPIRFSLSAHGTYPAIILGLARPGTEAQFFAALDQARYNLKFPDTVNYQAVHAVSTQSNMSRAARTNMIGTLSPEPQRSARGTISPTRSSVVQSLDPSGSKEPGNRASIRNSVDPSMSRGNLKRGSVVALVDPRVIELESEADRINICANIITATDKYYSNLKNNFSAVPTSTAALLTLSSNVRDEIFKTLEVGRWIVDFGYVVIGGAPKSRTFKMTNVGALPVSFNFDEKMLKSHGFSISPSKIQRCSPGDTFDFKLTYTTRKTMESGDKKLEIPINIKHGLKYYLVLQSNLTRPDISFSSTAVDFQKSLIGTQRTITIRMHNPKEVNCDWQFVPKNQNTGQADSESALAFEVQPKNGIIQPDRYGYIDIIFTPRTEKSVTCNLEFRIGIKDNPTYKQITCKGIGANHYIEFDAPSVNLGPTLPYRHDSYQIIEMKNVSEYDCEIYSLDFDKKYLEEETMLRHYNAFDTTGEIDSTISMQQTSQYSSSDVGKSQTNKQVVEHSEPIYFAPRLPGQPLWKDVVDSYNKKAELKKRYDMDQQMTQKLSSEIEEEKEEAEEYFRIKHEEDIKLEEAVLHVPDNPAFIPPETRYNTIIWGRPKHGKTRLAKNLAQTHGRKLITPDEVIEWHLAEKTEIGQKIQQILETKGEELAELIEKRDKALALKKKWKEEIIEEEYKWIEDIDMLKQAFIERLVQPDCNAGVIFDDLRSTYYQNESIGIEVILSALEEQGVYLVHIDAQKSSNSVSEESKVYSQSPSMTAEQESLIDNSEILEIPELEEAELEAYEAVKDTVRGHFIDKAPDDLQKLVDTSGQNHTETSNMVIESPEDFETAEVEQQAEEQKGKETPFENELNKPLRELVSIDFVPSTRDVLSVAFNAIPAPIFPNPDTAPLPPAVTMQIVQRPARRRLRKRQDKFEIYTPIDQTPIQDFEESQLEVPQQEGTQGTLKTLGEISSPTSRVSRMSNRSPGQSPDPTPRNKLVRLNIQEDNLDKTKTRWVLPAKTSVYLYVKFFSTTIGEFASALNFEIVGSNKKDIHLNCKGSCQFPTIDQDISHILTARKVKRGRPKQIPNCYMSKVYIQSEGKYDFGSLLVGRTFAQRHDSLKTNGETLSLTNTGPYDCTLEFGLRSSAEDAKSVFAFEQDQLLLAPQETKEVVVWAFPDQVAEFKDDLICTLVDSPYPLVIPVSCRGEKPRVELQEDFLKFERIILNTSSSHFIVLKSHSTIRTHWSLVKGDKWPEEFTLAEEEGILRPMEEKSIEVVFKAIKQQKFSHKMILEVRDAEEGKVKQDNKAITLEAEAFDINVNLNLGNEQGLLDFGNIRVHEQHQKNVQLKNTGLYEIKYEFVVNPQLRQLFKITPMNGVLGQNQNQDIQIAACAQKERQLPEEFERGKKRGNVNKALIQLQILEGASLDKFSTIPINVKLNAKFSKYSINPVRNINFGPVQNGESRTRQFEIRNDGMFDFTYDILEYDEKKEPMSLPSLRTEEIKKPVANKKEQHSIEIGKYKISPSQGTLAPGQTTTIDILFHPEGSCFYQTTLAIDISSRDPNDYPLGIPYVLAGESCIPGINTTDLDSIFEEQTVVPSLEFINTQQILSANVFAEEDMVFLFGTIIASTNPKGYTERFKINNNNKIPCNVNFTLKPRNSSKSEGFAFEVKPPSARIPPHEYTYVQVTFKPSEMKSYGGIFEAVVEHGEINPKTGCLSFEVRGDGTLPTVRQLKTKMSEEGKSLILFNKTRLSKRTTSEILVKNDGLVPATVRFDMPFHKAFSFKDSMQTTLPPKTTCPFSIEFSPQEPEKITHDLKMITLNNPFEAVTLQLQAEGYQEDVVFENLPQEMEDECKFGDCAIGLETTITFRMKNYSQDGIRFAWDPLQKFKFIPSVGHIRSRGFIDIKATFKPYEKVSLKAVPLLCKTTHIAQNKKWKDWDDSSQELTYITPSQMEAWTQYTELRDARPESQWKNVQKKMTTDLEEFQLPEPEEGEQATNEWFTKSPEPDYSEVGEKDKPVSLKISAESDFLRYSCNVSQIKFKSTLMFASRRYRFTIRNTSAISMPYRFKICNSQTGKLDAGPFSVSPRDGVIAPGCDEQLTAIFTPHEVEDRHERLLVFSVQNLEPGLEPLIIEMKGKSLRPVCHFELPDSTYREKKAQQMTPIDDSYQIIEFESLGTRVRNTKRFYIVNPTNQGYDFVWEVMEDQASEETLKQFKCNTSKGTILSGKKGEMVFEYIPETSGTHESFWKFRIPSEGIEQRFMVVGTVIEPNVVMEVGKVNFGPLLIGGKGKETIHLANQEHIPFAFAFSKTSIRGEDEYQDSLSVLPTSGTIPPNGTFPIEVQFKPKVELEFNYNLTCKIKRKSRPITLNVKGVGYAIKHSILYEGKKIQHVDLTDLIFGDFFINEETSQMVTIINSGNFNFDFVWRKSSSTKYLSISPENATVRNGESVDIELRYCPVAEHRFNKTKIALQIVSGPRYAFNLFGSARKPGIQFSFTEYDFGPCFVLRTIMQRIAYLTLANYDNTAISIESNFEKTSQLDVQLAPGQVLLPTTPDDPELDTKILKVPIIYTPRDIEAMRETIEFDINGIHKTSVTIKGEGIPLKLELTQPDAEYVNFGAPLVGEIVTRTVQLTNKSKRPVRVTLVDQDNELAKNSVVFKPENEFVVRPKDIVPIEMKFRPKTRLPDFSGEIHMKFANGELRKLLHVTGVSHGIEIKLMEEIISFGGVVQGSHSIKQVQLVNLGDIPVAFNWDTAIIAANFDIVPARGVIPANDDRYFDITFHPTIVNQDIRYDKVACFVKDSEPLYISLLGKCIGQPSDSTKELRFNSIVRTAVTQKVPIKNPTLNHWRISPAISSSSDQHWTGQPSLDIPAGAQADYEITYYPMVMTKGQDHEGTLFFALPDGSALLYNLFGTSQRPKPAGVIEVEVKAKQQHVQVLKVENWLKSTQRFRVKWKLEGEQDPATLIRGANTIDVPGGSAKEYKLNFLTYKLGTTKFKVTFKNEKTREFIYYDLTVKAGTQDLISLVELASPVRELSSEVITIENPLDKEVEITREMITCDNEYVNINIPVLIIPSHAEGCIELTYRPLITSESQSTLRVRSPDLGDYEYRLLLKGLPSSSQRSLHFTTSLGTELYQLFRFPHYSRRQSVYQVKIERLVGTGPADFSVDKPTVEAAGTTAVDGVDINCNIRFEPSNLGDSRALLTLTSPEAGEYTCVLNGHSTPPKPSGPIKIGKGYNLEFKNPFNEAMEFSLYFDNPAFSASNKPPIRIDSKRAVNIQVTSKGTEPASGRMIVEANDLPPWIYYLTSE